MNLLMGGFIAAFPVKGVRFIMKELVRMAIVELVQNHGNQRAVVN